LPQTDGDGCNYPKSRCALREALEHRGSTAPAIARAFASCALVFSESRGLRRLTDEGNERVCARRKISCSFVRRRRTDHGTSRRSLGLELKFINYLHSWDLNSSKSRPNSELLASGIARYCFAHISINLFTVCNPLSRKRKKKKRCSFRHV